MNAQQATLLGLGCAECGGGCGQPSQSLGELPPTIYWNTEPNTSADGREVSWTCNDWISWHKKIAERFGVERANEVTQQWWDRLPWYDKKKLTCFYDCAFYNYFRNAGGGWSTLIPTLICKTDEVASKVYESAGNVISNVADAADRTTGVAKWIIPAGVTLLAGGAAYYIYKHYLKGNEKIKRPTMGSIKTSKKVIHI